MVYQWKLEGIMPVNAEVAGKELSRISAKYGKMEAKNIVDESRDVNAPLHSCFEWRDDVAAEKFREDQARHIVRLLVVTEDKVEQAEPVRAFVHVQGSYQPTKKVIQIKDAREEMLQNAINEMRWFSHKYAVLSELRPVLEEIDKFEKRYRSTASQERAQLSAPNGL